MRKVIIGIHGLKNKPSKRILQTWWKKSIQEGLKRLGYSNVNFFLDLAYWAPILYPEPRNLKIKNPKDPLFISEPYIISENIFTHKKPRELKKKVLDKIERKLEKVFFDEKSIINYDSIADYIIQSLFKDLDTYYHSGNALNSKCNVCAKDVIRLELAKTIKRYRNRDILLISHSMGSIIAYDVLIHLVPDVKINTFITIGSPLGLPIIIKKILQEQNINLKIENKPPTPENIKKNWFNFSDLNDKIAINYNLRDDFRKNSSGIGPIDFLVANDYEYKDKKNHHKSYGYLRSPEVAKVIYDFLEVEKYNKFNMITDRIEEILSAISRIFQLKIKKSKKSI